MTRGTRAKEHQVLTLRRVLFVGVAGYLVAGGGLAIAAALGHSEAAADEKHAMRLLAEAGELRLGIDRARKVAVHDVPTDLRAVSGLRARIAATAAINGCAVTEFRASSDVAPYLSRYEKISSVQGWNQVEAQMTLRGKVREIMAAVATMTTEKVPFEFNSIEIMREEVNDAGDAKVSAKISFRVLLREDKK